MGVKRTLIALIVITCLIPLFYLDPWQSFFEVNTFRTAAKICAFTGTVLLFWQFVTGVRGITARFIPDLPWLMEVHKFTAKLGLILIVMHWLLVWAYQYFRGFSLSFIGFSSAREVYISIGIFALLIMALIVATSLFFRSRIGYRTWKQIHNLGYLVLPLGLVHTLGTGSVTQETYLDLFWWFLAGIFTFMAGYRLLSRFGIVKSSYLVSNVCEIANNVVEVTLKPTKAGIYPGVGQFVYLQRDRFGEAHPYTVTDYNYDTKELSVAVKDLGVTSGKMQQVKIGEDIYIDGPYGVFGDQLEAGAKEGPIVLIAGGIGVTAFKRFLKRTAAGATKNPVHFIYACDYERDIAYRAEFQNYATENEQLKYTEVLAFEDEWKGEQGFVTGELLSRVVKGDLKQYSYYLCGPPIMIEKIEAALLEVGVKPEQLNHELFGY